MIDYRFTNASSTSMKQCIMSCMQVYTNTHVAYVCKHRSLIYVMDAD